MSTSDQWLALPLQDIAGFTANDFQRHNLPFRQLMVKPEKKYRVSDTEIEWPGHDGPSFEADDDSNLSERIHTEPAQYRYEAPAVLMALYQNASDPKIVRWAIEYFSPESLSSMRGLLDSNFEFAAAVAQAYKEAQSNNVKRRPGK